MRTSLLNNTVIFCVKRPLILVKNTLLMTLIVFGKMLFFSGKPCNHIKIEAFKNIYGERIYDRHI